MDDIPISNPFDEEERSSRRTILWLSLGVAAICCGVVVAAGLFWLKPNPQALIAQYFPSATATASATPTRTPTPLPTATATFTPTPNLTATAEVVQATESALAFEATATGIVEEWRVVLTDPFDSNKNKWTNEASDDEFAAVDYKIADGRYVWTATARQAYIGWVRANTKALEDFYLSVEVRQVSGPDTADYGVLFREDEQGNFYYFGMNNRGRFILYVYKGEWSTLLDITVTDLVRPGETNRVTVIAEGAQFTFFVNDRYLATFTDEHIPKGGVALAIEMAQEGDEAVFEFDNFELRAP